MLVEELITIARSVAAEYNRLAIEVLAQTAINILRNRTPNDVGGYQREAHDLRNKIAAAVLESDAYLESDRVRRLFERSEYAGLLPKDILAKIASFVPHEFNFASSSSEAETSLLRIKKIKADFLSTVHTAVGLKIDAFAKPQDAVLLDLIIPEHIVDRKLDKIGKTFENFDKFFAYAGEFLEGSPIQPRVEHVSGSLLVLFLSFGGPAALLVIKIWNELMKAAKSTIEAKVAISNFKQLGADEASADAMLEQMTEKIYHKLYEDLERLSATPQDKVAEARRQEIRQTFNSQITYVVEKIELGVRLEVENHGEATVKALAASSEPLKIEQIAGVLTDQRALQVEIDRVIEQSETKLIAPPATK